MSGRKLTQEEFEERVKWNAPNLKVNGRYQNNRSKIDVECIICGYSWTPKAQSIMDYKKENKIYCPNCNGVLHKIYGDVLKLIASKSDDVAILKCEVPISTKDNFTVINLKCNHSWDTNYNRIQQHGINCPYCSGKEVLKGFNDIATTAPWMVSLLKNKNDAFKYTKNSGKKLDWICECGRIITNKTPNDVYSHGLSCSNCSDGISYPEKFISNLLFELKVDYNTQYVINGYSYRYDFYLSKCNCIIETHGIQHYEEQSFGSTGTRSRSLYEEQENDYNKMKTALENGYEYIVLDCRKSNMEHIKDSVLNSKLVDLLPNVKKVDWSNIHIKSLKSKYIQACALYVQGVTIDEILQILSISRSTCTRYLNEGTNNGICNYNGIQKLKENASKLGIKSRNKVRCITTNKEFNSETEGAEYYNISRSLLNLHLHKHRKRAGADPITKQDLIWEYV